MQSYLLSLAFSRVRKWRGAAKWLALGHAVSQRQRWEPGPAVLTVLCQALSWGHRPGGLRRLGQHCCAKICSTPWGLLWLSLLPRSLLHRQQTQLEAHTVKGKMWSGPCLQHTPFSPLDLPSWMSSPEPPGAGWPRTSRAGTGGEQEWLCLHQHCTDCSCDEREHQMPNLCALQQMSWESQAFVHGPFSIFPFCAGTLGQRGGTKKERLMGKGRVMRQASFSWGSRPCRSKIPKRALWTTTKGHLHSYILRLKWISKRSSKPTSALPFCLADIYPRNIRNIYFCHVVFCFVLLFLNGRLRMLQVF